ncbi:hypothetical protein ACWGE0_42505 [Lentzea sp. NPDC054927]
MLAAPANADIEKPPPGISAEAWRTRPAFPVFSTSAGPVVCFAGHVQGVGWQAVDCSDDGDWAEAGTVGQSRSLEAILIVAHNTSGRTCAQAHSKDIGWGAFVCEDDAREFAVGTTGQNRQMEAFKFGSTAQTSCNEAHVQNTGWQGYACVIAGQYRTAGTVGKSLRLEAARATFL